MKKKLQSSNSNKAWNTFLIKGDQHRITKDSKGFQRIPKDFKGFSNIQLHCSVEPKKAPIKGQKIVLVQQGNDLRFDNLPLITVLDEKAFSQGLPVITDGRISLSFSWLILWQIKTLFRALISILTVFWTIAYNVCFMAANVWFYRTNSFSCFRFHDIKW